ncbi:unnamed protein product [Symbiodinium pilosum]|uniref:PDZ domain-containing protein n=1 Tax=Symbiodinium pilosum TaxID=2952 RepID=A0A812W6P9_SYMPI|nr:unnamed protein product [Symbiodinium pilosum]
MGSGASADGASGALATVSSASPGTCAASTKARRNSESERRQRREVDVSSGHQITAKLTKKGKYGLKLAKRGDHLWRIIEILPEGTVYDHNQSNPQETLRENDLILKINGEDADIRILETAEDGTEIEVTVLRLPRSVAPPPYAFGVKPEAALLGILCSSWARHLGYVGPGVALSGLIASAVAAAPAFVVLAATFMGWSRSEAALVELTRARPQQPLERIGRYDLQKLEGLYLDGITTFYSAFYDRPTNQLW